MKFIIFSHLGLGDQFVMNGYIHYLLSSNKNIEEIYLLIKKYTLSTLEHLYSDYPKVKFYAVENSDSASGSSWEKDPYVQAFNKAPFESLVQFQGDSYVLLNFGVHSSRYFDINKTNWADAFYKQGNVDTSERNNFTFPSNLANAEKLYKRVVDSLETNEYILIHDDPERDLCLDKDTLMNILNQNKSNNLPTVYLGKNRYSYPLIENLNNKGSNELLFCESVIDYYYLIKNAKECHFIDSSIGVMTDYIKNSESRLYNHQYTRHKGMDLESTNNIFRINNLRNWTYILKKQVYQPTVSVVIASYNRFDSLLDTIKSIQLQTYPVFEIIVVNDGSSDERYKTIKIPNVTILHNEVNTKQIYGFPNISQVRNKGIQESKGDYIAFCDDDDVWLPEKLKCQMERMKEDGTYFCATDGYYCATPWDSTMLEYELKNHFNYRYPKYNAEHYWWRLQQFYGGIDKFPRIWNYEFLLHHNGIILSSVVLYKQVFEVTGLFRDLNMRETPEDYDLWKRILQHVPMSYIDYPCFGWAAYPYKYG